MMQSDGLCGRRKVWNLPASWKNKPGTQWLARSVSGVASQSCAYLWEELKSSLKWSENVSQKRLDRGNYSALHFGNGREFIMVRWRLVLPREGGVMVSAEASSWASVVCLRVECGLFACWDDGLLFGIWEWWVCIQAWVKLWKASYGSLKNLGFVDNGEPLKGFL